MKKVYLTLVFLFGLIQIGITQSGFNSYNDFFRFDVGYERHQFLTRPGWYTNSAALEFEKSYKTTPFSKNYRFSFGVNDTSQFYMHMPFGPVLGLSLWLINLGVNLGTTNSASLFTLIPDGFAYNPIQREKYQFGIYANFLGFDMTFTERTNPKNGQLQLDYAPDFGVRFNYNFAKKFYAFTRISARYSVAYPGWGIMATVGLGFEKIKTEREYIRPEIKEPKQENKEILAKNKNRETKAKENIDLTRSIMNTPVITGTPKSKIIDSTAAAEILKYTESLGASSYLSTGFYNTQYVHQEFNFYDEPLSVLDGVVGPNFGAYYAKVEKEKLEKLLKGYLELKKQDSVLNQKFKKYPNSNPELESYYKLLKQNTAIIDFAYLWPEYVKKISKTCDWDMSGFCSGKFFKTSEVSDIGYNYRVMKYGYSGKINPYEHKNKKLYKLLDKAIIKHPEIVLSGAHSVIENETGLDEEYFTLKEQIAEVKEKLNYVEKYLFVALPKKSNSLGQFTYIGNTNKGIPNGFGYLINEKKQLIAVGHWDEAFPTILYNVNIYHDPENNVKDYTYYPSTLSQKYSSNIIYTYVHGYQGHNIQTYKLYLGGHNYDSKENKISQNGYGTFFYSAWDKTDKQYFAGNYIKGTRVGKGVHHDESASYEGNFENGSLVYGTITSKTDKSVYTGQIKDWRMNGEGKKVYTNGKVEEGIFENDAFKMTKQQYIAEQNRKEQERIAEQRRLEEVRVAEEKRKEEVRKANMYKFTKPNLNIQWVDNRSKCCCCQQRYCSHESRDKVESTETEQLMYLFESLYLHHKKTGADQDQIGADVGALSAFVLRNFNYGVTRAASVPMGYTGMKLMEVFNPNFGSLNRQSDSYYIKDKRCNYCISEYKCLDFRDCK